jgi:hypothetical protein
MTRGGQKPVKTDPSDKTARPVRPAARPLVVHGRILDFVIFLIRVSGGPRVLCFLSGGYPPARPLVFKEKKKNPNLPDPSPNPLFPSDLSLISFSFSSFHSPSPSQPNLHATTPSKPQRRDTLHAAAPPPVPHLHAVAAPRRSSAIAPRRSSSTPPRRSSATPPRRSTATPSSLSDLSRSHKCTDLVEVVNVQIWS